MSKVKKQPALTGVRNTARTKGRPKASATVKKKVAMRGMAAGRARKEEASSAFVIRALDPVRKCGAGTSVQRLYLVRETVEGKTRTHLVFFDRHGWYCEHGRTCPAVAPARKQKGHIARVS